MIMKNTDKTKTRNFRTMVWVISVFILVLTQTLAGNDKPNILFIFADDHSSDSVACLGNTEIETPNLDRLAASGTTFSRAYNMGSWSGAVCVASRTMLNTGRFLWKAHQVYQTTEEERQAGRLWSEYLKGAGYRTYMTGKWHVKADAKKAFDVTGHVRGGMPNQTKEGYDRPHEGVPDPWSPTDPMFGGFWKGGTHWSEVVGDDAVGFLQQADGEEDPFFMYLAFNAPHDPRQAPQKYVDKYPAEKIRIPKNFLPEYPYKDAIGCSAKLRDEKLAPFPRTHYAIQIHRQEYYAIITHMDAQIGRILDALKRSGKAENTYVFFTADHGLAVGHHGLVGKQNLYEHSVKVPFMVAGPGIAKGRTLSAPIYLQDIMPTTLELAGVVRPDFVQFSSLIPLLRGEANRSYDAVYGAYLQKQRSVIFGDYKLLLYPEAAKVRLYHLTEDPEEINDIADQPASQVTINRLDDRLLELQQETGDELDLHKFFPTL